MARLREETEQQLARVKEQERYDLAISWQDEGVSVRLGNTEWAVCQGLIS